jgi:hypothetical protein
MGPNGGGGKMIIARFTPQGALDPQFGIGGWNSSGNTLSLVGDMNSMLSMTLQPDGKAVLVGSSLGTSGVDFATARFDGDPPLLTASLPPLAIASTITIEQVQPPLAEAIARWHAAGADSSGLGSTAIPIADLGGTTLGLASGHTIWLDANAAGGGGALGIGGGVSVGATEHGITPSLTVSVTNINANSADGGAGGAGGSAGAGIGGGVYSLGDFCAVDTVIEGNHASTSNDDNFT